MKSRMRACDDVGFDSDTSSDESITSRKRGPDMSAMPIWKTLLRRVDDETRHTAVDSYR